MVQVSATGRCAACQAVADALLQRLAKEPVKSHLDMRHRLDKDGKRHGKVIDYRVSELRVAELLDDLCEDMGNYTWGREAQFATEYKWVPLHSDGGTTAEVTTPQAELKTRKRELKNYCYGAVERAEDEIAEYLSSSQPHHEGLDEYLCEQLLKHCKPDDDANTSSASPSEETAEGEL